MTTCTDVVEATEIRTQLTRIVASTPFRISEHCRHFLSYVVEATLEGRSASLKERTLGVNVFGRPADYDMAVDNVVRKTAGEVRKRLAQYYDESEHHDEPRISLSVGSYVPQFAFPSEVGRTRNLTAYNVQPTLLDRFWQPFLSSPGPVLLVVGAPPTPPYKPDGDCPTIMDRHYMPVHHVSLPDVLALTRITSFLHMRNKDYRIENESVTRLKDLRAGPAVLIGAFNNQWTMRLTEQLRFGFDGYLRAPRLGIRDFQSQGGESWSIDMNTPIDQVKDDYGIVARVLAPESGQFTIVAAGLCMYGTEAAGEFLTNSVYMEDLPAWPDENWRKKSIEVVFATRIVHDLPGPPRILAAHSI